MASPPVISVLYLPATRVKRTVLPRLSASASARVSAAPVTELSALNRTWLVTGSMDHEVPTICGAVSIFALADCSASTVFFAMAVRGSASST